VRYSAGVDQVITPKIRVSIVYAYWHMRQLPRGEQLNPLVNGVRLDPNFANILATVTDAEIRRHDVNTTFNINLAAGAPPNAARRFYWRRLTINGGYSFLNPRRNGGNSPFDPPPSGSLDTEWGRGPAHARYLVNASITSTQVRDFTLAMNVNIGDGQVYHQLTGTDDNNDGILNDRPVGVGLWSLRGPGRETVNMRAAYSFALGGAAGTGPARYRAQLFVNVNNLTNHSNYATPSGTITSDTYGKFTAVTNPRTINMGVSVNF
jgi:hypothetical protein